MPWTGRTIADRDREVRLAALRELRSEFVNEPFDLDPRQVLARIDAMIKRDEEGR